MNKASLKKGRFVKLVEPFQIRQVKLRNRMVKPAQAMNLCEADGSVNERVKGYYEAIAKGGVGLLVVGNVAVDYPLGLTGARRIVINDDRFIPGLKELVQVIHKHDCPTFLQINHAGPGMPSKALGGLQPVAASSLGNEEIPYPVALPRGLTLAEIEKIAHCFVNAAERAQKAGFDGVEVHAAHPYLLNSFLSRAWNKRTDVYGSQNLESRARLVVEILRSIKQRLGEVFPVGVRINGGEWGVEKGITSEESQGFAMILEKAGADYISVTGYGVGPYDDARFPETLLYPEATVSLAKQIRRPGVLVTRAEAIKKVVSLPVITVGRLDPLLGEWILRKGKADLIAFARAILSDPELPNKVTSGRLEDIAPCTACLECMHRIALQVPVECRINPAVGKEQEFEIKPAEKRKKVVIVGGGPSGMEAARVAAMRGHKVVLYEKEHKLGGLLPLAALVKGSEVEDLPALIRYFEVQLEKLGVEVRPGKEANPTEIERMKPDALIVAVGGTPIFSQIPGLNSPKVMKTTILYQKLKTYLRFVSPPVLRWLTKFWMPIGHSVVIVGGLIQGCQLAEFLVKRGRKVTIVETSDQIGAGLPKHKREKLLRWLAEKNVTMLTEVQYKEINDKGLTIVDKKGEEKIIEADTIFPVPSLKPNMELFEGLKEKVPEIFMIGDCRDPKLILEAIADGSRIARLV